ncbi:hypothetical protein Tco_0490237 [Tanacetum coccineum]
MNSYARVLVEISADNDFVNSLVVDIPVKRKEHRLVYIDIEFEWRPTRCSLCKNFDHMDVDAIKREEGHKADTSGLDDELAQKMEALGMF